MDIRQVMLVSFKLASDTLYTENDSDKFLSKKNILGREQLIDTLGKSTNFQMERIAKEDPNQVEAELKELPAHLEYAFLEEDSKLLVIISTELSAYQKEKLMDILHEYKGVIAWSIFDIKGINPSSCMHKILMEDNIKPKVQPQRKLNFNMIKVIKKEVKKLLNTGIIYLISDIPWVSPIQVISNEHNKLIPPRTVTGWRVCIEYRKLNDATGKDHFPLPVIDQMLEGLAGHMYYFFLDGMFGYLQIQVALEVQEDYFYLPVWHVRVQKNAFWSVQCTHNLSRVYDVHL